MSIVNRYSRDGPTAFGNRRLGDGHRLCCDTTVNLNEKVVCGGCDDDLRSRLIGHGVTPDTANNRANNVFMSIPERNGTYDLLTDKLYRRFCSV